MKKLPGFYSSLGLLILLNAVIKPLWIFAIDRQVQNVVGVEAYGIYFSLFNLSLVFSFITDLGFTVFFNRQLAAEGKSFIQFTGNFLFLKILLAIIYFIIVFGVAWISGVKRFDVLFYVVLIQIFISLFLFFRAIITSQQWFRADALLSVADKTLMILSCGILLYLPSLLGSISIERFMFLQMVCMAVAVMAAFFFLAKKGIRFQLQKDTIPDKKIFLQAIPFGITVLLMSVHSRLDAFLLERINANGAYQAGIYAGAYRLLDASNMAGYLVASFMLPYVARLWSEKRDIIKVVYNCRHFLLMTMIGIICTIIFLAPWIQGILYHHDDASSVEVLRWCIPALIGYALVSIYGTVLTATGRIVNFCYINLFFAIINVVLNLLLIPSLGAKGCCIAALISQVFCGIVTMIYVKRKLHLPFHFRSLLIYTFTGVLLCGFFYICGDWPVGKWMLIVAAMMIVATIMLVTKLASISSLAAVLQKPNP